MAEKTLLMMAAAGITPIKVVPVEGRGQWNGQTSPILRISPKWGEGVVDGKVAPKKIDAVGVHGQKFAMSQVLVVMWSMGEMIIISLQVAGPVIFHQSTAQYLISRMTSWRFTQSRRAAL